MPHVAPFTPATMIWACDAAGAPVVAYRVTAAALAVDAPSGTYVLGLANAYGYNHANRVARDAAGVWWARGTGLPGPEPVRLAITGLVLTGARAAEAPAPPGHRPRSRAVHAQAAALPDALLHDAQRAPTRRRAGAPSADALDLFAAPT